ncbi:glutamyl-tRNA(Gln) amidotransferase subunit A, mitochondrial-like [Antedon mediterranea]|uniref:glutamyl-tRNA(Gln) amidotransferase subunit A, mitochondrial-like n=1 Tax=Antedon mediterranea TaxID=105859 RepID=UPI003AF87B31
MSKYKIKEIIRQLKEGKLSANKLYSRCRKRAQVFSELNFFVTTTFDSAKYNVEETDQRISKGKLLKLLDGIPVAVKDNFSTRDVTTTCASKSLSGYKPPYTATVVKRMLNEGAISMGKLNLDEFAMGSYSNTGVHSAVRNPWRYPFERSEKLTKRNHQSEADHTDHVTSIGDSDWFTTGGSSGGSAVAVAVGACFAALGSDTSGSVRVPAALCGVVGYKPTYGLLSRYGLIPLVHSLDCPGILTRYIDDAALVLNAIGGHDPLDSTSDARPFPHISLPEDISVQKLHIGIPKEFRSPYTTDKVLEAWSRCIDMFEAGGARVSQVSLPNHQYGLSCYNILNNVEVASNMSIYDGVEFGHRSEKGESVDDLYAETRHEGFNDIVRGRILTGNYFLLKDKYDKYFEQAMKVRQLICKDFESVFASGIDILLTPIVDYPGLTQAEVTSNKDRYAMVDCAATTVNLAGLPAVSIPVCVSSDGLPISLQLIASRFSDKSLLRTAKWIESQCPFPYHMLDENLMRYQNMLISDT